MERVVTTVDMLADKNLRALSSSAPLLTITSALSFEELATHLTQLSKEFASPRNLPVRLDFIYSSDMSLEEFYGEMDGGDTMNEWVDGVFTSAVRRAIASANQNVSWIVLDGFPDKLASGILWGFAEDLGLLRLDNGEALPLPKGSKVIVQIRATPNDIDQLPQLLSSFPSLSI